MTLNLTFLKFVKQKKIIFEATELPVVHVKIVKVSPNLTDKEKLITQALGLAPALTLVPII